MPSSSTPAPSSSLDARSLRRVLRRLLVAGVVMPTCVTSLVVGCSGGSGDVGGGGVGNEPGGNGSGGNGSSADETGECRAVNPDIDAGDDCNETYTVELAGDLSTCGFSDSGMTFGDVCRKLCGGIAYRCERVGRSVECGVACFVDGRRYDGLDDDTAPRAHDVASYLARMSFFEAASVDAFVLLARDLVQHGAPRSLVAGCHAAKRDEIRHAKMAARLARRHGAAAVVAPPAPKTGASVRSLQQVAIENAMYGCIRETFGVLVGLWQAEHAPTPALRAFFGAITADETRHAALAARIDAWARSQLSDEAWTRVERARQEALASLIASAAAPSVLGLGLPSAAQTTQLANAFAARTHRPQFARAA